MTRVFVEKKDHEKAVRLQRNKFVINEWLEKKVFEIPFETYDRIKSALEGENIFLYPREKFIKDLVTVYIKRFGEVPRAFRY